MVYYEGAAGTEDTTDKTPTGIDRLVIGAQPGSSNFNHMDGFLFWPALWDVALNTHEVGILAKGADPRAVRGSRLKTLVRFDSDIARDIITGTILTKSGTPTLSYDNPPVARLGVRGRGRLARVG